MTLWGNANSVDRDSKGQRKLEGFFLQWKDTARNITEYKKKKKKKKLPWN